MPPIHHNRPRKELPEPLASLVPLLAGLYLLIFGPNIRMGPSTIGPIAYFAGGIMTFFGSLGMIFYWREISRASSIFEERSREAAPLVEKLKSHFEQLGLEATPSATSPVDSYRPQYIRVEPTRDNDPSVGRLKMRQSPISYVDVILGGVRAAPAGGAGSSGGVFEPCFRYRYGVDIPGSVCGGVGAELHTGVWVAPGETRMRWESWSYEPNIFLRNYQGLMVLGVLVLTPLGVIMMLTNRAQDLWISILGVVLTSLGLLMAVGLPLLMSHRRKARGSGRLSESLNGDAELSKALVARQAEWMRVVPDQKNGRVFWDGLQPQETVLLGVGDDGTRYWRFPSIEEYRINEAIARHVKELS